MIMVMGVLLQTGSSSCEHQRHILFFMKATKLTLKLNKLYFVYDVAS